MPRKREESRLGLFTPGDRDRWVSDARWQDLPRLAKALFDQISEQPIITRAGVLQFDAESLAEQHTGENVSAEEIEKDLQVLVDQGFIVRQGTWLFVSWWFKKDRGLRNPNHMKPLLKDIDNIGRKDLRNLVVHALIDSLAEDAKNGAVFTVPMVSLLSEYTKKHDISLPDEITKAARKTTPNKRTK